MGKAFQCDLCQRLEAGDPVQTLTTKPAQAPTATTSQLCEGCNVSFLDWRTSRQPPPAARLLAPTSTT